MKFITKIVLILILGLTLASCKESKVATYKSKSVKASGDFLFEGPNTLQGLFSVSTDKIAKSLSIKVGEISGAKVKSVSLTFDNDSIRSSVESVLVQLVSDDLTLETLGTLNPLTNKEVQELNVNQELDVLPYLNSETAQVIVDANLNTDMDELSTTIVFEFSIFY